MEEVTDKQREKNTPTIAPENWNTKNIAKSIIEIITDKLGREEEELTRKASYTHDLGADSLDTVEIQMELETIFNIAIPYYDAEQIETIGDTVTYIEYAQKKPAPAKQ